MKGQPVDDKNLGALIKDEIYQSDNRQGSEIQINSDRAYNYLLYRPKGDEVEGRSQIQAGDVADMVDHIHAELQPMMDQEELVVINPEGKADVQQAEVETKAVNWYWRERCRGFEKLDTCIQDILLLRNGYLKVWPEESFKLPYEETLQGTQSQIEFELMRFDQIGQIRIQEERELQAQVTRVDMALAEDGVTPIEVETEVAPALYEITLLVIPKRREILMEPVAREDVFVSRDATDTNMQKPRFVAQRRWMSRNEAVSLGFDKDQVWEISASDFVSQQTKVSRQSDVQKRQMKAAHDGGDEIAIYECYYLIDQDGDGIAERRKIFYAETTGVLRWAESGEEANEIVRLVPFACGSALKVSHRHSGRSLFDKERAIEDAKRHLIRQGLDNVEHANNRRPLLGPGVNPDDVEETEIGAYIRCTKGIDQYGETQFTPIFGETMLGLDYLDKMRRERGGSSIESAGPNFMPGNTAAHTAERTMSASEQLAAMMGRNIGNTMVRDAFVILHQQLKLAGEALQYQDGDEWQTTEPRNWMERERFSVQLGLSQGERFRRASAYEGHFQKQLQLQQTGREGVLVDDNNVYQGLIAQANIQGINDASQLYTDPQSEQAQLARVQKANAVRQEQQMMQAQQQMMINAQMQAVQMQEETKRLNAALEQQSKHLDRLNKFVIEMTKIEADTQKDVPGGVLIGDDEAARVAQ